MVKKVLLLGSGALKIGEAGEFDYSASQALKALKEEGLETILVNPNIATYQTSQHLASKVYLLPITPEFVEKVIEREKPDGILLGFGGQTALNCGVELARLGVLARRKVEVLGTSVRTIEITEDRELFDKAMKEAGLITAKSRAVKSVQEALAALQEGLSYPVMVRIAFALGGEGSGVARNQEELIKLVSGGIQKSKIGQVLVEEYLEGWKEIEYEVVRDRFDNCITVCNMENLDPMGIHTGESIVVAPSQTLTDEEYHMLRELSIRAVRHVGIVGECNIQFAQRDGEYRVIEINARLSRSSALASKATGYPLAYVSVKLAIGHGLAELKNSITGVTTACFEPALDYVVVKIPRWDMQKFSRLDPVIGSEMKSVGEIMAIARSFEEAMQKGIRMLNIGAVGLVGNAFDSNNLEERLAKPDDKRIFSVVKALQEGWSIERINELTHIDPWFLHKIRNVVELAEELKKGLTKEKLAKAKKLGFGDAQLARLVGASELQIRKMRQEADILPFTKQIDTLAAEYPARTNYLFMTYNATQSDELQGSDAVAIIGSGPYQIGSSVEFDCCAVSCADSIKKLTDLKTIMINCNPETVSTDYDMSDKLFFEELTLERILDIQEHEKPKGFVVSMGGQIPNNLALKFHSAAIEVLGTSPIDIDRAEDRSKFSKLLDDLGVHQPPWQKATSVEAAMEFAAEVGYPVLVRPSYVLSGAAMNVAANEEELKTFLALATDVSPDSPIVISKFFTKSKEIEVDGVADGEHVYIGAIMEHIENAGIHSGDATIVIPPKKLNPVTIENIREATRKIALALRIKGPFNIQYIARGDEIYVIECNLRASRSVPFVSKTTNVDLVRLATEAMLGFPIRDGNEPALKHYGVKAPQFSFSRLKGADPTLGVEMRSTGEVACISKNFYAAFLESLIASGMRLPEKKVALLSIGGEDKFEFLPYAKRLAALGFKLYATQSTMNTLERAAIPCEKVWKIHEGQEPNPLSIAKELDLMVNITSPSKLSQEVLDDDYLMRRRAVDFRIPLITSLELAKRFVEALEWKQKNSFEIKAVAEFFSNGRQALKGDNGRK